MRVKPKMYGSVISDQSGNRGILLPDIEGIESIEEQIKIIKRKAGIFQSSNEGLTFHRFGTDKFY